ncbi:MAG: hypothetical protein ACFE0Q_20670 [Anaerolineae bacterium]
MFARKPLILTPPDFLRVDTDNWMKSLQLVVETFGGEQITEVDALLVRVVEDFVGGMVLKRVLIWLGTVKRDYIWKCDEDWSAELGLSRHQMKRIRTKNVLAPVVSCYQKSGRNRSTHYHLNQVALIARVADVLNVTTAQIRSLIRKPSNASAQNRPMHEPETVQTLTKEPSKKTPKELNTKTVVVDFENSQDGNESLQLLTSAGLDADTAKRYQALSIETINECITDTDSAQRNNQIKKTRQAYLIGALENHMKQARQQSKTSQLLKAIGFTRSQDDALEETIVEEAPAPEAQSTPPAGTVPSWADPIPEPPLWWQAVLGQIEQQMPRTIYQTIIRLSMTETETGITLTAGNVYEYNVALRYQRNIERLMRIANDKPLSIKVQS